ncbi:MAG: protein-export chaperone SecB [Gammaproteobacteria bacterium]|nr:protein-export chaperone SecB [Gammaproteobacteria bacterium]
MTKATQTLTSATTEKQPEFSINRIYIKDLSFEAPNTPNVFKEEWQPQVDLHLDTTHQHVEGDLHEVTLKVTVSSKIKDKTIFVVEVEQAGIFIMANFEDEQKEELIGSFCPNVLFPYARETVSDLITRGGFPPLYLAPVNFDAIYRQRKASAAKPN